MPRVKDALGLALGVAVMAYGVYLFAQLYQVTIPGCAERACDAGSDWRVVLLVIGSGLIISIVSVYFMADMSAPSSPVKSRPPQPQSPSEPGAAGHQRVRAGRSSRPPPVGRGSSGLCL